MDSLPPLGQTRRMSEVHPPRPVTSGRFPAIDVMRGLVMVLMTIDHASETLNHGRVFTDSIFFWKPGSPLPAAQFLTRWITHLCAPTFVLLAGTSLAIAVASRRAKGDTERAIDRYILSRGALIVVFEVMWMSPVMMEPGRVLFQVLYAIGASLMCMALLRRLSDRALASVGVVILVGGEAAVGALQALGLERTVPAALFFVPGFFAERKFIIAYPLLPWLGIMTLGWVLGRRLVAWRGAGAGAGAETGAEDRAPRVLGVLGALALVAFLVLRGIDGYGNMLLHRDDLSFVQWLHVSKYPPSLTFVCLELGIAALMLAGLFVLTRPTMPTRNVPALGGRLRLFGQVALFYYLLHIYLLHLAAWALGIREKLGLESAYIGAFAALLVLYPACRWYLRYKTTNRESRLGRIARFV
jgi:uncharacterized membrane protein